MMTINSKPVGMALTDLLLGFKTVQSVPNINILGISINSHHVIPGSLFVALQGLTTHGIDFAIDAVKTGAVAVLYNSQDQYSQKQVDLLSKQIKSQLMEVQWIGVDKLDQINGEIASRFFGEPSKALTIIGVTGTDGKTSVTHLLTQALMKLNKATASIGTLGYDVGNKRQATSHTTPDAFTLQSYLSEFREQRCEYVVMEVSSHALAQHRVNGCHFDIAVLTNLGRDHLDYHGTREAYGAAKARLFQDFELLAKVVNVNDELGQSLCEQVDASVLIRFSVKSRTSSQAGLQMSQSNDVEVRLIKSNVTDRGLHIEVATSVGKIFADTALIGHFNIENTLACISTLIGLGFDGEQIQLAVTDLKPIPGRMEWFKGTLNDTVAVVDFAHTEQALQACLNSCRAYTTGKIWCVFGCGGDRDKGKREGMGRVAEQLADKVIITDDNPRTESPKQIVSEILSGISNREKTTVIHDRLAAIEYALSEASTDDLVVITGKGHELEQVVGVEHRPFSDRQVVQKVLGITE
jgi:UDP-N-acetylmuramoyl-L-alanyl-D-glutamate--2,6-diaminopimelate ligase|tara:strand:+ start:403 stop:1971 length:1569 start_codon:yes stop_codon:yes gene_type:complete